MTNPRRSKIEQDLTVRGQTCLMSRISLRTRTTPASEEEMELVVVMAPHGRATASSALAESCG